MDVANVGPVYTFFLLSSVLVCPRVHESEDSARQLLQLLSQPCDWEPMGDGRAPALKALTVPRKYRPPLNMPFVPFVH